MILPLDSNSRVPDCNMEAPVLNDGQRVLLCMLAKTVRARGIVDAKRLLVYDGGGAGRYGTPVRWWSPPVELIDSLQW